MGLKNLGQKIPILIHLIIHSFIHIFLNFFFLNFEIEINSGQQGLLSLLKENCEVIHVSFSLSLCGLLSGEVPANRSKQGKFY